MHVSVITVPEIWTYFTQLVIQPQQGSKDPDRAT
jgi:hypothetical protein